jgi:hypothetical protein
MAGSRFPKIALEWFQLPALHGFALHSVSYPINIGGRVWASLSDKCHADHVLNSDEEKVHSNLSAFYRFIQ